MPPKKTGNNNASRTPKTPQSASNPWNSAHPHSDTVRPTPECDVTDTQAVSGVETSKTDAPQVEVNTSTKYPVSPPRSPTPKSATPKTPTPGLVVTSFTSQTGAARNAAVAEDVEAVNDLLSTMKLTVTALGSTLDALGEQTTHIAALGPAIDASHQISSVKKQLEDQHERQEQRMQEVKNLVKSEVVDVRLREKLKEIAGAIVKEIVRQEIVERVRKQLHDQIPKDMRQQALRYKRQIMEVKSSLHNSEARRHNSLIRSDSLEESLRPLLRPLPKLPQPAPSVPSGPRPPDPTTAVSEPPTPGAEPSDPTSVPIIDIQEAEVKVAEPTPVEVEVEVEIDLTPPTPSPLFPKDIKSLLRLTTEEATTLLEEYGLGTHPLVAGTDAKSNESKEDVLNRFMTHIGVNFHLLPGPTSPQPASPASPTALGLVM